MNEATACVLVTGSRGWSDVWALRQELDAVAASAIAEGLLALVVRHGACYPRVDPHSGRRPHTSADWLAHLWVRHATAGLPIRVIEQARPADWTQPCRPTCRPHHRHIGLSGRSTCPAAGNYRNDDMVREHPTPHLALAFRLDQSPGTTDCVDRLEKHGVHVEIRDTTSSPEENREAGHHRHHRRPHRQGGRG